MTMSETQRLVAQMPWVEHHTSYARCEAVATRRSSSAVYNHPDACTRAGKRESARCKKRAQWRFTALHTEYGQWAASGDYCWQHLVDRGLYCTTDECARTDAFVEARTQVAA